MRIITSLILVAAMAAGLSACGRKGKPIPPDGSYTRQYPDIQFPGQASSQAPSQTQDQGTENTSR